jgi:hypothetical protein
MKRPVNTSGRAKKMTNSGSSLSGKQRKRFKNTVFSRSVAGVYLVKKCPHGLGRRQIPLAMHWSTTKACGHIMLNESKVRLHHGTVENASWASIFFRGNIGGTTLFPS